jgi:hypothetical protein
MKVIELNAYTKYLNMFKMKSTAVYMVLRGRRVVEWGRGGGWPGVVSNQRAEHLSSELNKKNNNVA